MTNDALHFEIGEPRETPRLGVSFGHVVPVPRIFGTAALDTWRWDPET